MTTSRRGLSFLSSSSFLMHSLLVFYLENGRLCLRACLSVCVTVRVRARHHNLGCSFLRQKFRHASPISGREALPGCGLLSLLHNGTCEAKNTNLNYNAGLWLECVCPQSKHPSPTNQTVSDPPPAHLSSFPLVSLSSLAKLGRVAITRERVQSMPAIVTSFPHLINTGCIC